MMLKLLFRFDILLHEGIESRVKVFAMFSISYEARCDLAMADGRPTLRFFYWNLHRKELVLSTYPPKFILINSAHICEVDYG